METIGPFKLVLHRGLYTKKCGVLQGHEQPRVHSGHFAQIQASPDLNNETVWTSLRPVAETYITKQKSLAYLPSSKKTGGFLYVVIFFSME